MRVEQLLNLMLAMWTLWGFSVITDEFAAALGASMFILLVTGAIKIKPGKKKVEAKVVKERLVLTMKDKDGNESSVIIEPDGEIKTEGVISPEIMQAAKGLQEVSGQFTPEEMAAELNKQFKRKENE